MDVESNIHFLTSENIPDDIHGTWLSEVNENISYLDQRNEHIVHLILKLNWAERSEKICQNYHELVLNLVTAYNVYLRPVLRMLIRHFIPVSEEQEVNINPFVHQLLHSISQVIPSTQSFLLPMLADAFPYMKKSTNTQCSYLTNLFHLTSYLPNSRPPILELVITKLLQIDVHCPRDVILEAEDSEERNDAHSVFIMEMDTPKDENLYSLANLLDIMIGEVFKYIENYCYSTNAEEPSTKKLDWEVTKRLYKEFLTVFDALILPTHACAHVQFIMFYICSLRNLLCEGFVDYLWKKVQNPNISSVIRQTSICYMGSLLARAKYIHINMVQDCLRLMCTWVNSYIDQQSGTSYSSPDVVHHSTFYAVCQAVFYLVTFRHQEIVHNKKGRQLLKDLNLDRIVNCRLNPLRVCLSVVVKNFASVARNYQIAYCYTIIERNNRLFLPTYNDLTTTEVSSFSTLETFFPFDPYLLKRSGMFIQPLYRVYDGQREDAQIPVEEKDIIPDSSGLTSSQVQTFLPDLLHHGTSPGYRQHIYVSPKFR